MQPMFHLSSIACYPLTFQLSSRLCLLFKARNYCSCRRLKFALATLC